MQSFKILFCVPCIKPGGRLELASKDQSTHTHGERPRHTRCSLVMALAPGIIRQYLLNLLFGSFAGS